MKPPAKNPDRVKRRIKDEIAISQRRKRILELALEGHSVRAIADILGTSKTTVWEEIQTELLDLRRTVVGLAEGVRDIEIEQIASIIASLYPSCIRKLVPYPDNPGHSKWQEPNLGSVATYVRVTERRAKLLGLDAPKLTLDVNIPWSELTDEQFNRIAAGADMREIMREVEAARNKPKPTKNITPPKEEAVIDITPEKALVPRSRS
jgi:AcrR family transcriptional regulator